MKRFVLILAISAAVFGSTQQSSSVLVDASDKGSPVILSGTVSSSNDLATGTLGVTFHMNVRATNTSHKDILLTVITMDMTDASGFRRDYTKINDYFFTSELLKASGIETLQDTLAPLPEAVGKIDVRPTVPKASARVAFVEFLDGSTWGDPEAGKEILIERRLTWNKLNHLSQTFRTEGEHQFLSELTEPSELQTIVYLQRLYNGNNKDVEMVLKNINAMLAQADLHGAQMGSARASVQLR
jgi:hypothetical protein